MGRRAGTGGYRYRPDMHFRRRRKCSRKLYTLMNVAYVAAPDHPIHQEPEPLTEVTRLNTAA